MEIKTKVHVACSHANMFTTCLITGLSYQFTGRDMPLQKLSGVAIFVSLQECGFFRIEPYTGQPTAKIRFAFHFVERNKIKQFHLVTMRTKELWLVEKNHAIVKPDRSVASRGMKTYSESRIKLRNLQILKKMIEKSSQ